MIICRCEDLTLEDIKEHIAKGHTSLDDLKRITRCGMGPCQGKTCGELVLGLVARMTRQNPEDISLPTFRPLTKPVKLGMIACDEEDDKEGETA